MNRRMSTLATLFISLVTSVAFADAPSDAELEEIRKVGERVARRMGIRDPFTVESIGVDTQTDYWKAWEPRVQSIKKEERMRYAARIAKNKTVDYFRQQKLASLEEAVEVSDKVGLPLEEAIRNEQQALVQNYVSSLPNTDDQLILQAKANGTSYRTILQDLDSDEYKNWQAVRYRSYTLMDLARVGLRIAWVTSLITSFLPSFGAKYSPQIPQHGTTLYVNRDGVCSYSLPPTERVD